MQNNELILNRNAKICKNENNELILNRNAQICRNEINELILNRSDEINKKILNLINFRWHELLEEFSDEVCHNTDIFRIYAYDDLRVLDFEYIYKKLVEPKKYIKYQIRNSNYKLISLEEINNIEYNIKLINSSFTSKNIHLFNEFYNSSIENYMKKGNKKYYNK